MKKRVLALLMSAAMVVSMAACGSSNAGTDSVASSSESTTAAASSEAASTQTTTVEEKSEGELLAEQYGGFIETPMDLGGRTIKIVCSVGTRYAYATDDNGNPDPDKSTPATVAHMEALKSIEEDYNCKIEFEKLKGKDIVEAMLTSQAAGESYCDILDEGVSDTYLDTIYRNGLVMDMADPAIADIIKLDENPWTDAGEYGYLDGTQWGVNMDHTIRNCLMFNKDLAEQYGLGDIYGMVKDGSFTWSKFEEMCASIKAQSDGTVVPVSMGKENLMFPMITFSNGGKVADIVDGKHQFTGLSDNTLEALNWVQSLVQNEYLVTTVDYAAFAAGQAVFFFDYYGDLTKLTQGTQETTYSYGLLPCPIGPSGDGKYHGVTYTMDMKSVCSNIEKPEEVAAVLVAICNRFASTDGTVDEIVESALLNSLQDEESADMFRIMLEDLRCDYSRMFNGANGLIGGANKAILALEKTPVEAYTEISTQLQDLYDGNYAEPDAAASAAPAAK